MLGGQSKYEELEAVEMKEYLIEMKPQEKISIENMNQSDLKTMYLKVIEEQQSNPLEKSEPKRKTRRKERSGSKKISKQQKIKEQKEDIHRFLGESSQSVQITERILQVLTANLPESADKLQALSPEELQELYDQLIQTNQSKKRLSPQYVKMTDFIITVYPQLRNKIETFSQKEIRDLYDTCSVDTNFSANFISRNRKPPLSLIPGSEGQSKRSIPRSAVTVSSSNLQNKSIKSMRNELMTLIPEQAAAIDAFSDEQIEQLYESQINRNRYDPEPLPTPQVQKANPKRSRNKQKPNLPDNVNLERPGQGPTNYTNLGISSRPVPSNEGFEWQHRDGLGIKSKTYVFVHTVYQNPLRNTSDFPRGNMGKCQCSCCQNNTIVNLYNQLKSYFERNNK